MSKLFWLVFEKDGHLTLFIQPAGSLIYARMKAPLAGIEGEFQECHQLDNKTAKKVPKADIGKPLDHKQANALLKKLR